MKKNVPPPCEKKNMMLCSRQKGRSFCKFVICVFVSSCYCLGTRVSVVCFIVLSKGYQAIHVSPYMMLHDLLKVRTSVRAA